MQLRKGWRHVGALAILVGGLAAPATGWSAGFEVPENTTESLTTGGTGVALRRDPAALYFNPALLPRADGAQLLLDANFVNLQLDYQRDPLVVERSGQDLVTEFAPVSNRRSFFPVPFLAASWDLGLEDFTLAVGAFGPSAYGSRCYGRVDDDGECRADLDPDSPGAARHMMVGSNLLQVYLTLGVGYSFDLWGGQLSVGASAMAAYQENDFKLVISSELPPSPPWTENPEEEAVVTARDLRGWRPTGVLGLAYRRDGIHLGVSYRPPIRWRTTGVAEVDFPEALDAVGARLTDDAIRFETWQAGSLRFGVGFTEGQHPGRPERPLFELAADVVWEDHSRTESFDVEMEGAIANDIEDEPVELAPIRQIKNWRDTLSLRVGGSWGALPWLTAHAGFYLETPAQPRAYTNVDFVSWERRMLGFGSTFHLGDWIDLKLGYGHVFMPDRRVTDGEVYNQIPLSGCTGPDYQSDACEVRGQPPGNPQNEGSWSASFQIISAGLTLRFD